MRTCAIWTHLSPLDLSKGIFIDDGAVDVTVTLRDKERHVSNC